MSTGNSSATGGELSTRSLPDALTEALRLRILDGEFAPAAAITEGWVTDQYRVARPTARAAIERLIAGGLLVRGPHKSARIPTVTKAAARDIYLARAIVESQVCRILADGRVVPDEARTANHRLASAETITDFVDADVAFHGALVDAVGSERVSAMHSSLRNEMRLCMAQVQVGGLVEPAVIAAEHEAILDAIAAGAPETAAERSWSHLQNARSALLESFPR